MIRDIINQMKVTLLAEEEVLIKKRNRQKKLSPKIHKVVHESGRSTKNLWRQIISRAKKKNEK